MYFRPVRSGLPSKSLEVKTTNSGYKKL